MLGTLKEGQRGREVFIQGKAQASDRQFDIDPDNVELPTLVEDVPTISVGQRVDVIVKVIRAGEKATVKKRDGNSVEKMELLVADVSGACRLVLWEEKVRVESFIAVCTSTSCFQSAHGYLSSIVTQPSAECL